MAVSGLEQRFAPLILTHSDVWSPWGTGVLTPWSCEEDELEQLLYATKTPKLQQKEMKRSRSWGGLATFMQTAEYVQWFDKVAAEADTSIDKLKHLKSSTSQEGSTNLFPASTVSDLAFSTDSDDSDKSIGQRPLSNVLASMGRKPSKQHNPPIVKETMTPDPNSVTTIAVRNLPFSLTREELLQAVDASGFAGLYDFVYLPHKLKEHRNLGFAFINFVNVEAMQKLSAMWHKSSRFMVKATFKSVKPLNVTAATVQGHAANTKKARGSKMSRVTNTCFQPLMLASLVDTNN
jgi:hypothetical protein